MTPAEFRLGPGKYAVAVPAKISCCSSSALPAPVPDFQNRLFSVSAKSFVGFLPPSGGNTLPGASSNSEGPGVAGEFGKVGIDFFAGRTDWNNGFGRKAFFNDTGGFGLRFWPSGLRRGRLQCRSRQSKRGFCRPGSRQKLEPKMMLASSSATSF